MVDEIETLKAELQNDFETAEKERKVEKICMVIDHIYKFYFNNVENVAYFESNIFNNKLCVRRTIGHLDVYYKISVNILDHEYILFDSVGKYYRKGYWDIELLHRPVHLQKEKNDSELIKFQQLSIDTNALLKLENLEEFIVEEIKKPSSWHERLTKFFGID